MDKLHLIALLTHFKQIIYYILRGKSISRLLLILLLLSLPLFGFGCKGGGKEAKQAAKPITLDVWGVWDEQDLWQEIFDDYRASHPNVKFTYRKLRIEEYERALLEAWAEDRGPDIFMLHNTWVNYYQTKLTPLPEKLSLPVQELQGTFKKEAVWVLKSFSTLTANQVDEKFVKVVSDDLVIDNKIYALPPALDTLALYYNTSIFNDAGLASPPLTWTEFKAAVKNITRLNENNQIVRSAVAMGRADNVDRAADILSVLMMQNGASMLGPDGLPAFDKIPPGGSPDYNPGGQALVFYTDFANPIKEVYTWNETFTSSLDAFAQGQTAMMFGYSYHAPLIRAKGPKISFKTTNLPQIDPLAKKYNFANYWALGVPAKTEEGVKDTAWDFILFATTKTEETNKYLSASQKPPALRQLVDQAVASGQVSPFTEQVLTAESWYRGRDATAAEDIMKQLITMINQGNFTNLKSLLSTTIDQLKQTYKQPTYGQ